MARYNHAFEINLEALSDDFYGKDLTGAQIRETVLKFLNDRTDEELLVDINIFDTIKVDEDG